MILKIFEYLWPGDKLLAFLMARLNRQRLKELEAGGAAEQMERKLALVGALSRSPRAILTELANQQHYEVPSALFEHILGPQMKYSSGYWPAGVDNLAQAEEAMLKLYGERAQLTDGQQILELGCGWGSLTLWMARRYPNSRILAISNSQGQRHFIQARLAREGLTNVEVRTVDVCDLELPADQFDRVVTVEMLEHVRNYADVFTLLRRALKPGGKLFLHVFCHAQHPYLFDSKGWMETYFFSGGVMPSQDLYLYFARDFQVDQHWAVEGHHYEKTARAWLENMRQRRAEIVPLLRQHYGPKQWRRWWLYWQIFFLACAELFGYAAGQQWMLCHMLWSKPEGVEKCQVIS